MKCIRCGHDCKFKERENGVCPSCNRRFAFEPRKGDPVSDALFDAAIKSVSAEGQLRWGVESLYYDVCRRLYRGKRKPVGCLVIVGIICAVLLTGAVLGYAALALGLIVLVPLFFWLLFVRLRCVVWLTQEKFNKLYDRWLAAHGPDKSVIVRKPQVQSPLAVESDLGDYSFDRAIICDRARTVDLLLANHFHFENNCAVLSVEGYPQGPFETVRKMLKRNPRLEVFALHDASEEGCKLAWRLANEPDWFQGQARVTDVGLRPCHEKPFRGLFLKSETRVSAGGGITEEEAKWLSRYKLELAAIRPEQIVKRMFRAINKKIDAETRATAAARFGGFETTHDSSSDGGSASGDFGESGEDSKRQFDGLLEQDVDSFSSDASDSDGGADGFG